MHSRYPKNDHIISVVETWAKGKGAGIDSCVDPEFSFLHKVKPFGTFHNVIRKHTLSDHYIRY